MKRFNVLVTKSAMDDITELHEYIAKADSPERADLFISKLETAIANFDTAPERGVVPEELRKAGVFKYRQIIVDHYRIFYEITGSTVGATMVVDGRRRLHDILARRFR